MLYKTWLGQSLNVLLLGTQSENDAQKLDLVRVKKLAVRVERMYKIKTWLELKCGTFVKVRVEMMHKIRLGQS